MPDPIIPREQCPPFGRELQIMKITPKCIAYSLGTACSMLQCRAIGKFLRNGMAYFMVGPTYFPMHAFIPFMDELGNLSCVPSLNGFWCRNCVALGAQQIDINIS